MQSFKIGFFLSPVALETHSGSCVSQELFSEVWISHSLATHLPFTWKDIGPVWGHHEQSCHDLSHTGFCVNIVLISLGYIPKTEVPRFYGKHMSGFTKNSLFSRVSVHFTFPPSMVGMFSWEKLVPWEKSGEGLRVTMGSTTSMPTQPSRFRQNALHDMRWMSPGRANPGGHELGVQQRLIAVNGCQRRVAWVASRDGGFLSQPPLLPSHRGLQDPQGGFGHTLSHGGRQNS